MTGDENVEMLSSDATAMATDFKNEGNSYFNEHHFDKAIQCYSKGLDYDPNNAILYGNRAYCYLKIELFGAALADANKAIELDASYIKGYYRRAMAKIALQQLSEAIPDLKTVINNAPNDANSKFKLAEVQKEIKRRKFIEAIRTEEKEREYIYKSVETNKIEMSDSYVGPVMKKNGITLEFVMDMIEKFKNQKLIPRKYALQIMLDAIEYFIAQPSLVEIDIPEGSHITVCGDVHGQFYDLLHIFEVNGFPSETNKYLFNGDFVDRGAFSVEVIFTLLSFKLLYPTGLYMSRGNHEANSMNTTFGFMNEVIAKYNKNMYDVFSELFEFIPIANLIKNKIFVVHGGLCSRDDVTLDDIRRIDRFRQPPNSGDMCDLMWSDPMDEKGRGPSKRGIAIEFGPDVTENFLAKNDLTLLIRSHQVRDEGYSIDHNGKCITDQVFSAPNYCDSMGNKGAFIKFDTNLNRQIIQFEASPHPAVSGSKFSYGTA